MASKRNNNMETLDSNIKRLLNSALTPVTAAVFFKRGLLIHLKEDLLRFTRGEVRQGTGSDDFDENLGRLMAAAATQEAEIEAQPGFKERLRGQITSAGKVQQRQRRINVFSPALAAAVVGVMLFMVLVFGIEIYPSHWADNGPEVAGTMSGGTSVITKTQPMFFVWGTRTKTSTVADGETVSLSAGDTITVGSETAAVINLFNRGTLNLYSGTVLDINELKYADEQGSPYARVTLEKGVVTSKIDSFPYELTTPTMVAAVLGTAFRAEVIDDTHTYLVTNEGIVEVTMDGDTVRVSAGEEIHAVKGEKLKVKEASPPKLTINLDQPYVDTPDFVLTGETDVEAEVTVNGVPVSVSNIDGSFSVKLSLDPGPNAIVVIATSPAGKAITVTENLVYI